MRTPALIAFVFSFLLASCFPGVGRAGNIQDVMDRIKEIQAPMPGPGDFTRAMDMDLPMVTWNIPVILSSSEYVSDTTLRIVWTQQQGSMLCPMLFIGELGINSPCEEGFSVLEVQYAFIWLYAVKNLSVPDKSFTRYPQIRIEEVIQPPLTDAVSVTYYNSSTIFTEIMIVSACGSRGMFSNAYTGSRPQNSWFAMVSRSDTDADWYYHLIPPGWQNMVRNVIFPPAGQCMEPRVIEL